MVDAMGTTDRWAQPRVVREQITLFQPTLDDMILQDHEVRLLDETLRTLDWGLVEVSGMRLRLGSGSGILQRWGSHGEGQRAGGKSGPSRAGACLGRINHDLRCR
jgi:hypothetical protein